MSRWSRLQVIFLGLLGFFVIIRFFAGPPPPKGAIRLSNLDSHELSQQTFQVSKPLRVLIDATGSIDERSDATGLAAYPWIMDHETGQLRWSMNTSNTIQDGSLVHVEKDELRLEAGTYTVYYASYGQIRGGSILSFRKDHRKWHVTIYSPEDQDALRPISRLIVPNQDHQIWQYTSLKLKGREKKEHHIEVYDLVELDIFALGELATVDEIQFVDYSRIENAVTGELVWQLSLDNSVWAGGIAENRMFHGKFDVSPGIYRILAVTNNRHHSDNWTGNPPYDPQQWGIRIRTDAKKSVTSFDPWTQREPIIALTQVGDDEQHTRSFTVRETSPVIIYALGEFTDAENAYDFAWLERQDPSGETGEQWRMTYHNSSHAGGARKNRRELKFLTLEPGVYRLGYESDGSHSMTSWNSSPPDAPDRWGVAMFSAQNKSAENKNAIELMAVPE